MAFEQDLEYLDGNESMGEYIERMNGRKCKMEEPLDDDLDHGPETTTAIPVEDTTMNLMDRDQAQREKTQPKIGGSGLASDWEGTDKEPAEHSGYGSGEPESDSDALKQ
ncbi:hypothetical protein BGX29_008603 [Mortierella sp. GBA35]|nr:hypothetical protein BGX29_008603 [Mortierella sp. GBA35]